MNNKIMFGVGGVIVGVFLVVILTSMNPLSLRNRGTSMMGNGQNTEVSQSQMMGGIDKRFIEQMIPHHESAIAMAKLALLKSKRPEIKTLASAIIEGQSREIGDMNGWYKSWYGKGIPQGVATSQGGMMSGGGMGGAMGGQDDVNTLKNAPDFDKAFIEQMIPHHELAIMMAQMLQSGTSRVEMEQLAKNIIESQSKEVGQMQSWYKVWYR